MPQATYEWLSQGELDPRVRAGQMLAAHPLSQSALQHPVLETLELSRLSCHGSDMVLETLELSRLGTHVMQPRRSADNI